MNDGIRENQKRKPWVTSFVLCSIACAVLSFAFWSVLGIFACVLWAPGAFAFGAMWAISRHDGMTRDHLSPRRENQRREE